MQTSIEWLRDKLAEEFRFYFSDNIFEEAKEIHKQEIIEAYDNIVVDDSGNILSGEQYYETTFKK